MLAEGCPFTFSTWFLHNASHVCRVVGRQSSGHYRDYWLQRWKQPQWSGIGNAKPNVLGNKNQKNQTHPTANHPVLFSKDLFWRPKRKDFFSFLLLVNFIYLYVSLEAVVKLHTKIIFQQKRFLLLDRKQVKLGFRFLLHSCDLGQLLLPFKICLLLLSLVIVINSLGKVAIKINPLPRKETLTASFMSSIVSDQLQFQMIPRCLLLLVLKSSLSFL